MSQQEINDFFESVRHVFTLLFPFLLVGLVTSFVDFLQKHLGRERFKLTKLIVGLVSDMFLAFVITCIGYEIGLGEFGIAAMVAVSVHKGGRWIDKVVDQRLEVGRIKENEREKLSTKESIKSVIKPNGITASITTKKAIKIQSNVCNSTLVYPEYAHSTQCYPHL